MKFNRTFNPNREIRKYTNGESFFARFAYFVAKKSGYE
jgi:hypothetical protein